MTPDSIRMICMRFPGVKEDFKWESHLYFDVSGKIFLIPSPDESPDKADFSASDHRKGACFYFPRWSISYKLLNPIVCNQKRQPRMPISPSYRPIGKKR